MIVPASPGFALVVAKRRLRRGETPNGAGHTDSAVLAASAIGGLIERDDSYGVVPESYNDSDRESVRVLASEASTSLSSLCQALSRVVSYQESKADRDSVRAIEEAVWSAYLAVESVIRSTEDGHQSTGKG